MSRTTIGIVLGWGRFVITVHLHVQNNRLIVGSTRRVPTVITVAAEHGAKCIEK